MDHALIKAHERELFVTWKVLSQIWSATPFDDLLRLEAQRAAETMLFMLRSADCIDPSVALDGTQDLLPEIVAIH